MIFFSLSLAIYLRRLYTNTRMYIPPDVSTQSRSGKKKKGFCIYIVAFSLAEELGNCIFRGSFPFPSVLQTTLRPRRWVPFFCSLISRPMTICMSDLRRSTRSTGGNDLGGGNYGIRKGWSMREGSSVFRVLAFPSQSSGLTGLCHDFSPRPNPRIYILSRLSKPSDSLSFSLAILESFSV